MSRRTATEPFVVAEDAMSLWRQLQPFGGPLSRNENHGRDNALTERAEFVRWIAASSAASKLLEFPCAIWHRDKPDFWITTPSFTIGVEVCGLVHPVVSRARHLAHKYALGPYREPSPKEIDYNAKEEEFLRVMDPETGAPKFGHRQDAAELSLLCLCRLRKKIHQAARYTGFDQLILAMYDNSGLDSNNLRTGTGPAFRRLEDFRRSFGGKFAYVEIFGDNWSRTF